MFCRKVTCQVNSTNEHSVVKIMSLPSPCFSPKKRKHAETSESASVSPLKKAKKAGKEKKSKGKRKADGEFQVVSASVVVSIPPRFSLDPLSGVHEMLDSLVMKYVPALEGVMLCHSNTQFVSDKALLKNECPFSVCTVHFDATVWSPQIGMKLRGKINLCSPDHISLLVHRTFNVSIPREHIMTENWVFEYGPAENDPEFGPHAVESEQKAEVGATAMDTDESAVHVTNSGDHTEPHGSWVHKITSDKLGGKDGILEFTVIGMTVANQMLSLRGSLQPDPFSPLHVPQPAVPSTQLEIDIDEEDEREVSASLINQRSPTGAIDDSDEEEDPFAQLNLARDEAIQREAAAKEREKEEKAKEKEEKKRRKKERKERKEKEKALAAVDGSTPAPSTSEPPTKGEKPPKKKRKKETQEA
ncbi:hypothetical protein ACEPAH_6848 [Sanghuangporus vaninii]